MPTHVSQSVRELKELGRNLYAAIGRVGRFHARAEPVHRR